MRSPCGGCTPGCVGGVWGEGEAPFEAGGDLALTELGSLTLRREERRLDELWVTNTAEATLCRIDAARAVDDTLLDDEDEEDDMGGFIKKPGGTSDDA